MIGSLSAAANATIFACHQARFDAFYAAFLVLASLPLAKAVRCVCGSPSSHACARHRIFAGCQSVDDDGQCASSPPRASPRLPVDVLHNAVYCVTVRVPGTPDVPIFFQALSGDALLRRCVSSAQGSPVSLCGFLHNLHVQGLLGHELLQAGVLFLERLELFGHLRRHAAILLTPTVVSLGGNL